MALYHTEDNEDILGVSTRNGQLSLLAFLWIVGNAWCLDWKKTLSEPLYFHCGQSMLSIVHQTVRSVFLHNEALTASCLANNICKQVEKTMDFQLSYLKEILANLRFLCYKKDSVNHRGWTIFNRYGNTNGSPWVLLAGWCQTRLLIVTESKCVLYLQKAKPLTHQNANSLKMIELRLGLRHLNTKQTAGEKRGAHASCWENTFLQRINPIASC